LLHRQPPALSKTGEHARAPGCWQSRPIGQESKTATTHITAPAKSVTQDSHLTWRSAGRVKREPGSVDIILAERDVLTPS
jgi:hypothetical protein